MAEIDVRVWKKPGDDDTDDLYTLSVGRRSVCIDLTLDGAIDALRRELEEMSPRKAGT